MNVTLFCAITHAWIGVTRVHSFAFQWFLPPFRSCPPSRVSLSLFPFRTEMFRGPNSRAALHESRGESVPRFPLTVQPGGLNELARADYLTRRCELNSVHTLLKWLHTPRMWVSGNIFLNRELGMRPLTDEAHATGFTETRELKGNHKKESKK